ncbi:protein MTSS 1-like isoform X8 [Crassostrea angulata]|uniref:protein MTSS 1 isoform X6 n=1 Tax=Magallana gigas TaxID=29159 RepID=UPI0005C3AE51|nr:protein MTSS 1-like isoform X8 [Crassostrea angulata]|eukprot:XP_011441779.1 PREDICTED: metastasis suppressor protein 1 isoform X9 [Crassostrea gigas]
MEGGIEKDCTALGGLFQTIITDMRASSVVWEDFTSKAAKLHTSLKATLAAIGGFLEAFQKVADMATGSRGATKEIGSALTRLCMRHKSIEAKLKALTGSIIDNLVNPVQEHSEEWKKSVAQLDKEHAKEYKKARQEIKKAASDTMRLQKKVKKGKNEMQLKLDNAMEDVNNKYLALEMAEKNAVRTALIEERSRFCFFISYLRPFVDHEVSLLTEITHLQEIMEHLCMQCNDPHTLPPASEQVIMDVKGFDSSSVWNFSQHSPPSSPSSIGSRKSSMCSINSITSSSSGSIKSHSPSHLNHLRNSAQLLPRFRLTIPMGTARLTSVSSQDSGFTSQDTLFLRPATPTSLKIRQKDADQLSTDNADADSQSSTPSDNTPSASSTWTNWPNPPNTNSKAEDNRPHTISSAYEKTHNRPALSASLFEPPSEMAEEEDVQMRNKKKERSNSSSSSGSGHYARPQSATINKMQPVLPPLAPKPKSKAVPPPKVPTLGEAPAYVNMSDLANMAANKRRESETDLSPQPGSTELPEDLVEAMQQLDSATAALNSEYEQEEEKHQAKMKRNTMELAKAIQELEASTAALQSTYDGDSSTSQHSLQCSSGYGTMNNTPAHSQDTIAMGGIPVSRQTGAPITRRSSMNTPKPPPPVRRSSSITTANPQTLQRLRNTPPRQLQSTSHGQDSDPNRTSLHRRSNSSGGEPAYAELQTIQMSIHARQQLQYQPEASPYASVDTQQIAYSAPPTPSQYGNRSMPPSGHYQPSSVNQAELMQKLNAQFSALNAPYHQADDSLPPPPPELVQVDPELPPPPSAAELEEMEKVYSTPAVQRPPPVNPKPAHPGADPSRLRASLVSELKGLRKVSNSENDSEC